MVSQDSLASFLKTAELLQISGLAGSSQNTTNSDQSENIPKAPPEVNLGKPPDSPTTVSNKISSEVCFTSQKVKEKVEAEKIENIISSLDPVQSCSYQTTGPVFVKTESLDKDYDEMELEPADITNPDNNFDSTNSQLEEPSILERSLKAHTGK